MSLVGNSPQKPVNTKKSDISKPGHCCIEISEEIVEDTMPNLLYTMGLTYSLFYAIHSHNIHYQRLLTLSNKLRSSTIFSKQIYYFKRL